MIKIHEDLHIGKELDLGTEVEMYVEDPGWIWINKEQAIKLADHLYKLFAPVCKINYTKKVMKLSAALVAAGVEYDQAKEILDIAMADV